MSEPRLPTDAGPRAVPGGVSPATPAAGPTDVVPAGPSISMTLLEHDHALVVVRGEICAEFLPTMRRRLTSLVNVGVRYVVVDLAEVTACPPRWSASSLRRVGRCIRGRAGCDRSRQPRAW
jgi:hypothetical protein